jgi:dynein heavy chain
LNVGMEEEGKVPLEAADSKNGCVVYGLFLQGAGWDRKAGRLVESKPAELFVEMPLIWLRPVSITDKESSDAYQCPVYKTSTHARRCAVDH